MTIRAVYAHYLPDIAPAAMLRSIVDHARVVSAPAYIRVGGGLGFSHTTLQCSAQPGAKAAPP